MVDNNFEFDCDWLKKWDHYSPHRGAVVDGESLEVQPRTLTYRQLFHSAQKWASLLRSKYAIRSGDRVAVLAMNDLDFIILFFATQRLGATLVPINYRLTAPEIEHILQDCQAKLLVYQSSFEGNLRQLQNWQGTTVLLNEGASSLAQQVTQMTQTFADFESKPESIAMVIYTSGTTGFPKGAMISHRMLFWNSVNTSLRLNVSQNDSAVIFLPFFHTGGWNVLTTPFLHRGAQIVLLKKFDAEKILKLSEKYSCNLLFGVPTTMDMMARDSHFDIVNLSSVRYAIVGGEPMPLALIERWHEKGIKIRQGYGLTEFGPNVFSLNEEDSIRKIGSIGFPNFYIETKVVDDHGQSVKCGEIGELLLKGPSIMSGYLGNPGATEATIRNGWLLTGDLVRFDDEGYFYVVGRKKEMYKSGGENVYPAEVEKVIGSLSGIREVAVIGVPDPQWGEVGKAFISLEQKAQLSENQILEHCLKNLAKFKVPKSIQFLSDLPKGDSGKILKKNLK
jgi:fatty-acyl-CoA synthase